MTDGTHGDAESRADEAMAPHGPEWDTRLSGSLCFGIGVAAAVLGLLPWMVTGMRLPLQNLWGTETLPRDMPVALLPLNQYYTTLIAGLLMTGAGIAGLVTRLTRHRLPRRGSILIALAVFLVHVSAGVQAVTVVANGLEQSRAATFYLVALIIVVIGSTALALLVLLLVSKAPIPGATIGLSVGALATGIWLNSLIAPVGAIPSEVTMTMLGLARWLPAVLVGVAIGWCGVRTVGRAIAVLVSLLALWIGPAAITAVSAATGTRILLKQPLEMLAYGSEVFRMAASLPELVAPPMILAVIVGTVVLLLRRRRQTKSPALETRA